MAFPVLQGTGGRSTTVSIPTATTSVEGLVTLAANGGTTAGTVVQANDSRLSGAPGGPAGGDLGGTYPNPTVVAVHTSGGTQLTVGAPTDGQVVYRSGTTLSGLSTTTTSGSGNAGKLAVTNGGGKVDSLVSDADTTTSGKLQLTGDLGGTATSPTVVQARGLRDSLGNTRPMSTTTAGYPLVVNSAGQVTTADATPAATQVTNSFFHIYFYAGTYAADLGVFTTGGTLAEVTTNNRSQTRFSSAASTAGIYLTALSFQRGMGGKLTVRFVPYSAVTSSGRFWIGFISTSGPGSGATPAAPFYGLSCDPAAGDTVWYATTANGSSIDRTSTTKAYDVTHEYVAEITMGTTGISVKIADTTLGEDIGSATAYSNTTYAPGSGIKFRPYVASQRVTGTWGIELVAVFFEANFPNTP